MTGGVGGYGIGLEVLQGGTYDMMADLRKWMVLVMREFDPGSTVGFSRLGGEGIGQMWTGVGAVNVGAIEKVWKRLVEFGKKERVVYRAYVVFDYVEKGG